MTSTNRKHIAVFFAMLFMAFLSAPVLVLTLDDSVDVSAFYGAAEEEEKENKNEKTFEIIMFDSQNIEGKSYLTFGQGSIAYFFKAYPKPHLNLISPPPEQNLL
jgi:hypothetical protein